MQAIVAPKIIGKVKNFTVVPNKQFDIDLTQYFEPQDGSLHYVITHGKPTWLMLDKKSGQMSGIPPMVHGDVRYSLTVMVSNNYGYVMQRFFLSVVSTDVIDNMANVLELIYSLRKQKYGLSHLHPYTPSLLEYLYTFYDCPELREAFINSLKAQAMAAHIKVPEKVGFKEFYEITHKLNPSIDHDLQQRLQPDSIIFKEAMNLVDFRRLFRQGSQPLGAHAIPDWNHQGAPELHNWSSIDTILSGVEIQLRKLKAMQQLAKPYIRPSPNPQGRA